MKEFYDREDFREQIKKIVNETNESIVILLAGYTGVGKSALLDYLSEEKVFNREIITVKNSSKSATSNESGYYLRTLYKCITSNQNFEKPEIYTLSSKYLFEKGKDILKEFLNLSNIKMKEDIDNPSLVFMKDFIIYTLNNVPLIINIENIQNIDAESLDYLKDILKNAQNTIFIFQYTLESEHKRRLKVFQNELMDLNVNVKRIDLNPLNFEIAKRILPNGNYTINELQDINRIYSDSHGNLIELKLYERNNDPFNQIGEKLRSLEEKYLFILYLILYSRGRIEFKKIYEIVMDNPQYGMSYMQIEHNLNYLVTNNIVEEYDRYYTVHDSIIDKLDHLILDGHKRLAQDKAYNVSLHYYMQEYSKEKTVESLFNIYYLTMLKNDPTLIQYFEEIKKVINDMHNPKELIAELEDFVFFISNTQTISVKQKDKLYCYFIEILLNFNYFDKVSYWINQIDNKKTKDFILLYSEYLVQKSDVQSLDELSILNDSLLENDNLKLKVLLSLLHLMMRLCSNEESKKFAKKIVKNKTFEKYPEYGFALVNYAEYLNSTAAIYCYKKAIDHLNNTGLSKYSNIIYSNIVMCYGYLNDVAHAREYLNKMRLDTYESREAYYNNSSALDIIDGKISDATIYSLNNALLLSKIDFTRIIIHSNLLICYTKMKKFEVAFEEVNYLTSKNIKVFHSETLQFMVYRNIMFYAEHTKNEALYEAYKRKMMKLIELDSMKESGLSEIGVAVISGKVDENHFYTKLGCYPEFICYWGVPLLLDSK